jgi:small subunit ribosomal protein S20
MAAGAIPPPLSLSIAAICARLFEPVRRVAFLREHRKDISASIRRTVGTLTPARAFRHCRRTIENMANTTSAKKATRKIARRTIVNKSRRTQMRSSVRSVEEAIKRGDRDAALKAMARAEPELMRAAQGKIIHKNNASRKVSRLSHQIAKLAK